MRFLNHALFARFHNLFVSLVSARCATRYASLKEHTDHHDVIGLIKSSSFLKEAAY